MKVLVAGATGAVGRHAVQLLLAAGHSVRALSRKPVRPAPTASYEVLGADLTRPETLAGVCAGIDAVIACAGASRQLDTLTQRSGFLTVDLQGNRHLLAEARRAGAARLVYVSLAGAAALLGTEYAEAHERFAEELAASGIPFAVVRPTECFQAFAVYGRMARAGIVPFIGSGLSRTNPIHEAEVARACVEALARPEESRMIGGPETFTRHRLAEMAFDAIGQPPRLLSVPPALLRAAVFLGKPFHPRLSAALDFGLWASQVDLVAPAYGTRRLGDYLRAANPGAEPSPS